MKENILMLLLRRYKNYRLLGGSILESVIALTIIIIVITVSIGIISILMNTENNLLYIKVHQKIKDLQWETINNKTYKSEAYYYDSIQINKKIEKLNDNEDLVKIKYFFKIRNKEFIYKFYRSSKE